MFEFPKSDRKNYLFKDNYIKTATFQVQLMDDNEALLKDFDSNIMSKIIPDSHFTSQRKEQQVDFTFKMEEGNQHDRTPLILNPGNDSKISGNILINEGDNLLINTQGITYTVLGKSYRNFKDSKGKIEI